MQVVLRPGTERVSPTGHSHLRMTGCRRLRGSISMLEVAPSHKPYVLYTAETILDYSFFYRVPGDANINM